MCKIALDPTGPGVALNDGHIAVKALHEQRTPKELVAATCGEGNTIAVTTREAQPYRKDTTVIEWFQETVAAMPDAVAVEGAVQESVAANSAAARGIAPQDAVAEEDALQEPVDADLSEQPWLGEETSTRGRTRRQTGPPEGGRLGPKWLRILARSPQGPRAKIATGFVG